jgi:16S rRNA (guanine527-N7)-methyltransferase
VTLAPAPPVVRTVFGDRYDQVRAYGELLATEGVDRGLMGPREVGRIWERHILNCAAVAELVPAEARLADVGSGAGLPGIVLALARPDIDVTLIEPLLRRVRFLDEVVEELALSNVTVERSRAEERATGTMDVTTARAVAPLDRLARWCLPLLRPTGTLLALKGETAAQELEAAEPTLRALHATAWSVESVGGSITDPPATVIRVVAGQVPKNESSRRRTAEGHGRSQRARGARDGRPGRQRENRPRRGA